MWRKKAGTMEWERRLEELVPGGGVTVCVCSEGSDRDRVDRVSIKGKTLHIWR